MVNNIKQFIFKHWDWLVFGVLALMALGYLIVQRGVWAFADSGFYYPTLRQALEVALSKFGFFSNTDGFYFGFDSSSISFSHLLAAFYQVILTFLFGADLGQIMYYFLYYFLAFYFGAKLLETLFPHFGKTETKIGALFLAFNPISILLVTLYVISYVYVAFIIFLYAFLNYLKDGKIRMLALSACSGIYLLSYFRLIPIVIVTCLMIGFIFFDKKYFKPERFFLALAIFILVGSPFIVGNVLSFTSSENVVGYYQEAFDKYTKANYEFKSSFINAFANPGGFTPSTLSFFYNNRGLPGFADNFAVKDSFEFYKAIQIIFNIGLLILALVLFKNKTNLKIIALILVVFLINTLGFFSDEHFFNLANNSFLVFLYNDYGFMQFTQSFLYAFLIAIVLFETGRHHHQFKKTLFAGMIVLYLLVNLLPLLSGHYGLKKVGDIPESYQKTFFTPKSYGFKEASLFTPYHWLNFEWSPYFLDFNVFPYSKYKSLVIPNLRLLDNNFVEFYNRIYEDFKRPGLSNLFIFNIKNIFAFHDVVDANKNIDTYKVVNLENNSQKINNELIHRSDLNVVESNYHFTHYRFASADDFDYFIYSPKSILDVGFENFYLKNFDLSSKPVLLNKDEYNLVNTIKDINFELNSPYIFVKASPNNSNKYYLKLKVNKNYPFLIQLNQTFSPFWRLYFVDQKTWDQISCQSQWQEYWLTQNSKCAVGGTALDFRDFGLLDNKFLKRENHLRGNLAGNAFLITPQDIPDEFQDGEDLYLVLYFNKQLYYIITLLISASVLLVLIVFTIVQKKYENHR
ncbi:MAG: hypothetical protein HUU49_01255 [Candidatus Buchananbacteria bacterium]|nr:hypothetical protein [Candidatus Buchananbacteria bacterium]